MTMRRTLLTTILGAIACALTTCRAPAVASLPTLVQPVETRTSAPPTVTATRTPSPATATPTLIRETGATPLAATPTPTSPAAAGGPGRVAPSRPADAYFPVGVFEDANLVSGDATEFAAMLRDLKSHGLDSVMFTNNFARRDAHLLDISDDLGIKVFMLPAGDLNTDWWPASIPADAETARQAAQPIVDLLRPHPSFQGYIVKDEPGLGDLDKVALMTQAFKELDPARHVAPLLVGIDRVEPIFAAAQPDVMLVDVYPAGRTNKPCDFTMTGFGYQDLDFVSYIRLVTRSRSAGTPLWAILQTHQFEDSLRQPTPAEVRAQYWLAIGEGAKGIFWFIYSSQPGWVGLADNPALYRQVAALAQRTAPLRGALLNLHKVVDKFRIAGARKAYISTLVSASGASVYVVAVNMDCKQAHKLSISSPVFNGQLKDLETDRIYALGASIVFPPGDGKIFVLVNDKPQHQRRS
jgi:hypothetical protein